MSDHLPSLDTCNPKTTTAPHAPAGEGTNTAGTHTIRGADVLTDTDRAILDFETRWQRPDPRGAKDTAIWGQFRVLPARYYQQLAHLLSRDDALAYAPLLVGRLRRLREAREAARTG